MFRKRNGSMGFSFTRFAQNAIPSFFSEDTPARMDYLEGYRHDMLYAHQLLMPTDIYAFNEHAFLVAGVVDSETLSKKVFKALKKCGVLTDEGRVNTYVIGPKFTHQLAVINIYRQKELVRMLFWWEEECQRLTKLDTEEKELTEMIESKRTEGEGDEDSKRELVGQLKFARERVRMKKRQRPSQRRADVEEDRDDLHLAFHGRSKSVPNIGLDTSGVNGRKDELPPEYYAAR